MPHTRKASLFDLSQLVTLENICFTSDKMSRRSYQNLLKKNSAEITVIEANNSIIASATVFYRKNSKTARIYSIAVDPKHRKSGIASSLCETIEKQAALRECQTIQLEVRPDNLPAIQFYKKNGYEIFDSYKQFYEDGSDAIRMRKSIT